MISQAERIANRVQVTLFGLVILLPLAGWVTGLAPESSADTEMRELAPFPALGPTSTESTRQALERYPGHFQAYFDDHFGFRPPLIRAHHSFKARFLRISPTPKAVIGKDGWLFYAGQGGIDLYRATVPLSPEKLADWRLRFEHIREWLEDRGIAYLLFMAPSKPSIYPEFLPDEIVKAGSETRMDQLARALGETELDFIDPRDEFLAAKAGALTLYRKTDSHWTPAGGLLAAEIISDSLRSSYPTIPVLELADFDAVERTQNGGDVARVMALGKVLTEEVVLLNKRQGWPWRWIEDDLVPVSIQALERDPERGVGKERRRPKATVRDQPGLPELVVFHDSFGPEMLGFLACSASRGVYYWQYYMDTRIIDRERPDVVVQEIVERTLMFKKLVDPDPELGRDFELRRRFRSAGSPALSIRGPAIGQVRTELEELPGPATGRYFLPEGAARFILVPALRGDLVLRIELKTSADLVLRLRRGSGDSTHERELTLRHAIAYAELSEVEDGEELLVILEGPAQEIELVALELRPEETR